MSEPVLFFFVPAGSVVMSLADWIVKHPKCRCGKRMKLVSADGQVVAQCPAGCKQGSGL